MKKITNIVLVFMLFVTTLATAQYGIGTTNPSASAVLDISSTSKGFLMPRMTTLQRDGIATPAAGLLIFNSTSSKFNYYNGTAWIEISGSLAPVAAAPDAPVIGEATASAGAASVTFSAPANDGGAAITNYIVTSSPGDFTGQGTASPIEVTGLVNGTAYTFTVVAVNSLGTSAASAASNSVTPATVPDAPTSVVATIGDGSASVAFTAGAANGSPITNYTVTASPGGLTASGTSSPIVVSGLTNGTAYTFTIVATSALGNSVASSSSASITPLPPVPGIVSKLAVRPGSSSVLVSWEAPITGGIVESYVIQRRVTFGSPQVWTDVVTLPASTSSHNVTGLSNFGEGAWEHHFRVKAVNIAGESVSDQLTAVSIVNGTVLLHDNFNAIPSTTNWEVFSGTPTVGWGNELINNANLYDVNGSFKFTNYGGATKTAQTIHTIDRSTSTKEVQFTYYTSANSNTWHDNSYVGLVDPQGRTYRFFIANSSDGNTFSGRTGDWDALGATTMPDGQFGLGVRVGSTYGGYSTVRIVLPTAGGLQIYNGSNLVKTFTAAQMPASFNNLKFFVFTSSGGSIQYIDNFSILSH